MLSNPALAGDTGYVATVDQPFTLAKMSCPLGAATVSNDLVFTALYSGVLIALDRTTGAIVYQRKLPPSANAPSVFGPTGGSPQLVVNTVC